MLPEQQIILRLLVSAVLGIERERLNWVAACILRLPGAPR
jgi:hypothetical protein